VTFDQTKQECVSDERNRKVANRENWADRHTQNKWQLKA